MSLPIEIGERIVSHPFDHYGVVGGRSKPTICEVILDEPLKHTDRVWSSWDEVQREQDYEIENAQRRVIHAEYDLENCNTRLRRARTDVKSAQTELRSARAELKKAKAG